MDIEQLKEEYEKDITWEFKDLATYMATIPLKIAKYQNYWFGLKNTHDRLEKEYNDKWIIRYMYYKQDFDITLKDTEIRLFLEKDTELNEIKLKLKKIINIIEWLEKCMKNLDSIRWDCKLTLETQKFINGIV